MPDTPKLHRYQGAHATVTWDAKRCIHAAECVRGLPAVFDTRAKPWVQPGDANVDRLAETVYRCPTGALKLERADGQPEPVPALNSATLTRDGPLHLHGDFEFLDPDGTVVLTDTRIALCRCGASQNKPLCDGSHRRIEFREAGMLRAGESPPLEAEAGAGRVTLRIRNNGPLMCTGPLTVRGTNGLAAHADSTFFCRCGGSQNKPYCDGTHKRNGFAG